VDQPWGKYLRPAGVKRFLHPKRNRVEPVGLINASKPTAAKRVTSNACLRPAHNSRIGLELHHWLERNPGSRTKIENFARRYGEVPPCRTNEKYFNLGHFHIFIPVGLNLMSSCEFINTEIPLRSRVARAHPLYITSYLSLAALPFQNSSKLYLVRARALRKWRLNFDANEMLIV
jgi:hypothetical protein